MLLNIYKDEEDDFNKLKLLLSFINPEAAQKIFNKQEQMAVADEITESDDFLDEVSAHTQVSPDALKDFLENPDSEGLDVIEPV